MGPAEQPVPGFNVPVHLMASPAAVPAISLTCAPLQLLSMDFPPQARSARGLGHAGPGLYSQGLDKPVEEKGMCTYASILFKACHSVFSSLPERPLHVPVSVWTEGPNQRFSVRRQNISSWGHREPQLGPHETLTYWDRTPSNQVEQQC